MARGRGPLFSLIGGALLAASLGLAHADPGSGSGGDDDHEVSDPLDGSGGDDDNSGAGSGGDDDNSGAGSGGDDDNSGSGGGSGSGSNSGSGNSGQSVGASAEASEAATAQNGVVYAIEVDDFGREFISRQVLLAGVSRDLQAAKNAGFDVIAETRLDALGVRLARIRIPAGVSAAVALTDLRRTAPNAVATLNTVYRSAQSSITQFVATESTPRASQTRRASGAVGIIDTGIDAGKLPQASALANHLVFGGSRPVARDHGSAVAAIAAAQGAQIHVADVFGQSADGALAASAENIAEALNWMITNNIAVINISIEGPNNPIVEQLVRRAGERGHVIVAAAGNGGPMARPAFPAAFDGVVAVTAIDTTGRPYMRANRGAYIDFAAQGVNVTVGTASNQLTVSGTSFAAPAVAAYIATRLHAPSPRDAARIVAAMRASAMDLGAPGQDPIFGWGALAN